MDKENVLHTQTHTHEWYSAIKEKNACHCRKTYGTGDHRAKQSKPDS